MKDFRTVSYESDDILDTFQYEALRCQAHIGVSRTHKVLNHFTSHSPLLFRLTMSRKLRNILEKIDELVTEMNTFGLLKSVEPPQVPCRQTHSGLDEYAEIFGRDDDKEVVVKLLLDQQDNQRLRVLPIFGMGGLGKTTLAKMVYNDHRVQQHFHLSMWHCVSENFEATAERSW
uniref:NB-ARC domain-containing protein n=2 Tax=Aegilops tauschii TaxID=37682 RepID=A0A453LCV6_AEGTS